MQMFRALTALILSTPFVFAQSTPTTSAPPQKVPTVKETVEVTATKLAEDPQTVPTAIEVFSGEELQARGGRDLRTAMSAAIGVEIAPGGDAGPASSVPAFWGLKEFDAFLLVVDGVPWGGAFNPALTTLDLNDIDRIEVLRGPAPVTYGATSFVGVIQVVHKDAAAEGRTLTLHGGSYGSFGGSFSTSIPLGDTWSSRFTADGEHLGFRDERTDYRRGHALWRVGTKPVNDQRFWFNIDANWLDQNPPSPRPREEAPAPSDGPLAADPLLAEVPVDANHNPAGAFLDDHRISVMAGFDRKIGNAFWSTSGSVSQSRQDIFRGFLTPPLDPDAGPDAEAHGLKEKIHLTDIYIDSHFSWKLGNAVTFLAGADYLHGTGNAHGADFDYEAPFDGKEATVVDKPNPLDVSIRDHRDFFGPYASVEWRPFDRLRLDGGVRLNITHESRTDTDPGAGTQASDDFNKVRVGANVGATLTAWQHDQDALNLYVNYRDQYKPAAIDFGIGEADAGGVDPGRLILKPETSRSVEGGLKSRLFNRRMEFEASGLFMTFSDLVVAIVGQDGNPHLTNAGKEQFKGFETGVSFLLPHDLMARANYTYHDATFTRFSALADDGSGVVEVFDGKRIEVSPLHLAAVSLFYAPSRGFLGGVSMNYTGSRFLDRDNNILAEGFPTVDATAGYRTRRWEIRIDARNLGNRRNPVAESEMGPDQFYLMTSRRVEGSFTVHF
jgi:iron complex outermembrane receptor protein